MKTVAIIQAWMSSTRLPGKVMKILEGRPVLEHVVERLKLTKSIDHIVVATTEMDADDFLFEAAGKMGIGRFRGSENDVLSRYAGAAADADADVIVRITSDCPLIDPVIVDEVVAFHRETKADFACNVLDRTYPRGLDTEVFTREALIVANAQADRVEQREHVTPYFYQNPDQFRIAIYKNAINYSQHRWTLDTPEDWKLIQQIYKHLYKPGHVFGWTEVLGLMEKYPDLVRLNENIEQKKLSSEYLLKE